MPRLKNTSAAIAQQICDHFRYGPEKRMRRLCSVFVFAFVVASAIPALAEKKAPNAPLDDPRVVAVRELYQSVGNSPAGRLKEETHSVPDCRGLTEDRTIFTNANGVIRKYVWRGGGDDSAHTIRHYYDAAKRLRFVFVSSGAVNDTHAEFRIYFDEHGKRIREERKLTSGPGYTFPSFSDEEGLLQRDPRRAFEHVCEKGN